jgi:hypothetical protein
MLGLYDYPETPSHPAFNLLLRVNFAEGAGENQAFRFVGPEGVITIGGNAVTLARRAPAKEPGYTIDTFPAAVQDKFLEEYRAKYPEGQPELRPGAEEVFAAPSGYSDSYDHFVNFFESVRTRKPSVEDGTFSLRAAGPALLTNDSYFEGRPVTWDPVAMKRTDEGGRQTR